MTTKPSATALELEIQRVHDIGDVPDNAFIERCVRAAVADLPAAIVNLRIVDEAEGRALNRQWRGPDHATNVLSFPADLPSGTDLNLLGDIVLCAPVIAREAREQDKSADDHWAHLIIHGLLHLRGYDHISSDLAERMETREIELLRTLGIADPYVTDEN